METPIEIFPEEIWKQVLDMLPNSSDIVHTLYGIPELQHLLVGRQCSWLIGAVMPHLFPKFMSVDDIKCCRLVSKRWETACSTTIEAHPERHAYDSPLLSLITETHFNYCELPRISTNLGKFCYRLSSLDGAQNLNIGNNNPFPGRQAHISGIRYRERKPTPHGMCIRYAYSPVDFAEMVPGLTFFGHHISVITIQLPSVRAYEELSKVIRRLESFFNCLKCLPNLKSIKLDVKWTLPEDLREYPEKLQQFRDFIISQEFPFRLETIDLCLPEDECHDKDLFQNILKILANHQQVKKLVIQASDWKQHFGDLFPNLCELCVREMNKSELKNILQDLAKSPIKKLRIHTKVMSMSYIIKIVSRYDFEALEIFGDVTVQIKPPLFRTKPVPSVRTLRLVLRKSLEITYRCLRSFQSLEYLNIVIQHSELDWDSHWKLQAKACRLDPICRFPLNLSRRRTNTYGELKYIWNELPNLKTIRMYVGYTHYQHSREYTNSVVATTPKRRLRDTWDQYLFP